MSWFIIALIGYFLLAVVFVLDKFILTKSVQSPVVYTFYSTIFMLALFLVYPFGVESLAGIDWIIACTSGISFGFALWAMYIALRYGEASHITPFVGAVVAMVTFLGGWIFLEEQLVQAQIIGVFMLIIASFLFSFEKSKEHNGIHRGFLWAGVSGLLFALSHLTAKYIYEAYPFLTGLVTTKATVGFVGLIALIFPVVWQKKKNVTRKKRKTHTVSLVVTDKIFGIVGVLFIQYAIAKGSVTVVNALSGIQYVCMFVLIYLLSKHVPKLFREYFTKKELLMEIVALLLVVSASILLVV